jgi:hypothetical protein
MRDGKTPVLSIGAILFALGAVLFYMQWMTHSYTNKAIATIISFKEFTETDSTGQETSHTQPYVWFVTEAGDTIKGNCRE